MATRGRPTAARQLVLDLQRARDLIAAPDGFVKNKASNGECGFCTTGALTETVYPGALDSEKFPGLSTAKERRRARAYAVLSSALEQRHPSLYKTYLMLTGGFDYDMLIAFNDRPRTRQKDVVALYDEAIRVATEALS